MQAIQNFFTNGTTILQSGFIFLVAVAVIYLFAKQKKVMLFVTIGIAAIASVFVFGGQNALTTISNSILEFFK